MKILLIDDDQKLLNLLEEYLVQRDMAVSKAFSGKEGLDILKKETFNLVILDIMMPGIDGLEVLRKINSNYKDLPVIMLTARGEETDRIVGLELGADDYLVKPFSPRELVARIKAIFRRQEKLTNKEAEIYSYNGLEIDETKRQVKLKDKTIELTSAEFEILLILSQNKGIVLPRDRIMDLARGKDFVAFDRSIDVHISHLRQKIEEDPKNPSLIKTVWGVGYIFAGE